MRLFQSPRFPLTAITLAAAALIVGCGGNSDPVVAPPPPPPAITTATFEMTLVNLTAGQPLSPLVAIAHTDGFSLFKEGEVASLAIENIAEAGNTASLLALIGDSKSLITSIAGPAAPLLPGAGNSVKVTFTVPLSTFATTKLSFATMLGNTNDGFTGINGESLASIAVDGTRSIDLLSYDAGTERNTESADTVPGPATAASGGKRESFNAMRDDVNSTVHLHPGIVSKDDGLPTSALTQAQRWDNPVARVTIHRTQ